MWRIGFLFWECGVKYSFLINQAAVVHHGFDKSTDLVDWAFIDYLMHWQTNPKSKRQNGHVWLDYKHVISETPLLGLRSKQSISNRVRKLVDLGLINVEKDNFKRAYFRITTLTSDIISFRACPNSGTPVHEEGQPVLSDVDPVHEKGHITNQHLTNHQEETKSGDVKKPAEKPKSTETWNAYSRAYLNRYTVSPLRGAKVNSLICQFVDQVGSDVAPLIAEYYVSLNDQWYLKKSHDIASLVQNAQSVMTQWATGNNNTSMDYRSQERKSNNYAVQQRIEKKIMEGKL